jgi:hypothetical protein
VAAGLTLALAAGCKGSVSIGSPGSVPKNEVQSQVATQLAAQVHQPKPNVTCPGSLPAKVGATLNCTLVAQGSTDVYPVSVVVTTVNNGHVNFTATVAPSPINVTTSTG